MEKRTYCVVLLGPIGCGKSTQLLILSGAFILPTYDSSIGLNRVAIHNPFLAPGIKSAKAKGQPVADDVVLYAFETELRAWPKKSFLVTGVTRKVTQVPRFMSIARKVMGVTDFIVVNLELPQKIALKRLRKRALVEKRKDDNSPRAIANRLGLFKQENDAILALFGKKGARVVNAECHHDQHVTVRRIIKAIGDPFVEQFIHHRKRKPRRRVAPTS